MLSTAVKNYTLCVIIIVAIVTAKFYLVWASRTACEGPCQFYSRCWRKICPSLCKANENDMKETCDIEVSSVLWFLYHCIPVAINDVV